MQRPIRVTRGAGLPRKADGTDSQRPIRPEGTCVSRHPQPASLSSIPIRRAPLVFMMQIPTFVRINPHARACGNLGGTHYTRLQASVVSRQVPPRGSACW